MDLLNLPIISKKICYLDWRDVGNSEGLDHYEANTPDFVSYTFHYDHNEPLSENGDEVSILCSEYNYNDNNIKDDLVDINPVKVLNNIQKHSNRLVIAQLTVNSLRNKFASLLTLIKYMLTYFYYQRLRLTLHSLQLSFT